MTNHDEKEITAPAPVEKAKRTRRTPVLDDISLLAKKRTGLTAAIKAAMFKLRVQEAELFKVNKELARLLAANNDDILDL